MSQNIQKIISSSSSKENEFIQDDNLNIISSTSSYLRSENNKKLNEGINISENKMQISKEEKNIDKEEQGENMMSKWSKNTNNIENKETSQNMLFEMYCMVQNKIRVRNLPIQGNIFIKNSNEQLSSLVR